MKLSHATWQEVEDYLKTSDGIIVPVGSTEQHGPIGLIGTDALCAEAVADRAGELAGGLVAPVIGYTPAPFNMAFPGTVSVRPETFCSLLEDVLGSLVHHGFRHLYVLNAHGANLDPLHAVADELSGARVCIRSWWGFPEVAEFREALYGDWEGMHATPSEVSITQALYRVVDRLDPEPPEPLSAEYISAHSGDRHGPPDDHRKRFPDGRVGAHSGLARPEHGHRFVDMAARAAAADYEAFLAA